MAVQTVGYQDVSKDECWMFIGWVGRELGFRDWFIDFIYDDRIPDDFKSDDPDDPVNSGATPATIIVAAVFQTARVWVSPARLKGLDLHPFEAIAHELLHILFSIYEGCDKRYEHPDEDAIIFRLQHTLVKAYRAIGREDLGEIPPIRNYFP